MQELAWGSSNKEGEKKHETQKGLCALAHGVKRLDNGENCFLNSAHLVHSSWWH